MDNSALNAVMEKIPQPIRHSVELHPPVPMPKTWKTAVERAEQAAKPCRIAPFVAVLDRPVELAAEINALIQMKDGEWLGETERQKKLATRQAIQMLEGGIKAKGVEDYLKGVSQFAYQDSQYTDDIRLMDRSNLLLNPQASERLQKKAWKKYRECFQESNVKRDEESFAEDYEQFITQNLTAIDQQTLVPLLASSRLANFLTTRFDRLDMEQQTGYVKAVTLMLQGAQSREPIQQFVIGQLEKSNTVSGDSYIWRALYGNNLDLASQTRKAFENAPSLFEKLNGVSIELAQSGKTEAQRPPLKDTYDRFNDSPAAGNLYDAINEMVGELAGVIYLWYGKVLEGSQHPGDIIRALNKNQQLLVRSFIVTDEYYAPKVGKMLVVPIRYELTHPQMGFMTAVEMDYWQREIMGGPSRGPRSMADRLGPARKWQFWPKHLENTTGLRVTPGETLILVSLNNFQENRLASTMGIGDMEGRVRFSTFAKLNGEMISEQAGRVKTGAGGIMGTVLSVLSLGFTYGHWKKGEASDPAIASAGFGLAAAVLAPTAELMKGSRLGEYRIKFMKGVPLYKVIGYAATGAAVIAGILGGLDYIFTAGENTVNRFGLLHLVQIGYGGALIGTSAWFAYFGVSAGTLFITFIILFLIGFIIDAVKDNEVQLFLRKSLNYGIPKDLTPFASLQEQNKALKDLLPQGGQ